jgi:hypothetical protein
MQLSDLVYSPKQNLLAQILVTNYYFAQFSTRNPGILLNSFRLFVTKVTGMLLA